MLFLISDNDFFDDNPHARLMPEFGGASSNQMKFVCLFADWSSPYRKLNIQERRERSLMAASFIVKGGAFSKEGEVILKGKNQKVEAYIDAYKGLQGIEDEELTLNAIKNAEKTIRERLNAITDDDTAKDIGDTVKALTALAVERKKINALIDEKLGIDAMFNMQAKEDETDDDSAWERRDARGKD